MSAPPLTHAPTHTVSVIVPCRNESSCIETFCFGVLRQALPDGWALQLLIADGLSDDGTRESLVRLSATDRRVCWIDNPGRIVSTGLNAALAHARGEAIVRMDVHTDYADDYVAQCLAVLAQTGADNVGGPWRAQARAQAHEPGAAMQHAIAATFQSRWVAGGALSRRIDHEGWVDTVYLGCWPRATFERFGTFDETLVRNQDDEHNLRIVRGGGRVWQSSRIRSVYRPRATLGQVFRQYLQYGYWKPFVMKKHRQPASLRHLVPGLFVALLAALGVAALLGAPRWPLVGLVVLYLLGAAAMTTALGVERFPGWAAVVRIPAVIVAQHMGYGAGSLLGWSDVLRHGRGRARFASLTR